jgi:glucan phosphoethanolaminetransferase (alkaline phosphatase superfamily)
MEPRNRFQGMNSASLCSLAGRYDNSIPIWYLAPIDCLKIPSQLCGLGMGEAATSYFLAYSYSMLRNSVQWKTREVWSSLNTRYLYGNVMMGILCHFVWSIKHFAARKVKNNKILWWFFLCLPLQLIQIFEKP